MVGGNCLKGEWISLDAVFEVVRFVIFGLEVAGFEEGEINVDALQTIVSLLDILKSSI